MAKQIGDKVRVEEISPKVRQCGVSKTPDDEDQWRAHAALLIADFTGSDDIDPACWSGSCASSQRAIE